MLGDLQLLRWQATEIGPFLIPFVVLHRDFSLVTEKLCFDGKFTV